MGLDQLASDHIQNSQCIRDNNCKKQYTGDTGVEGIGSTSSLHAPRFPFRYAHNAADGLPRRHLQRESPYPARRPRSSHRMSERRPVAALAERMREFCCGNLSLYIFSGSQRIPHRVRNQHLHTQNPMDHLTLHEYIRIPFASLAELPPDLLEGP